MKKWEPNTHEDDNMKWLWPVTQNMWGSVRLMLGIIYSNASVPNDCQDSNLRSNQIKRKKQQDRGTAGTGHIIWGYGYTSQWSTELNLFVWRLLVTAQKGLKMGSGLSAAQKTNRTGAVLGFCLDLICSGEASLFSYQIRYESFWLVVDAIPGRMLCSLAQRGSLRPVFSCCASSRMFTVHIIDFPVYKITGHTWTQGHLGLSVENVTKTGGGDERSKTNGNQRVLP